MSILRLELSKLRNLAQISLEAHPQLNIIAGINGSGKTSLLEGIYLLGRGRSFRTNKRASLIQENQDCTQLFSLLQSKDGVETRLGIEICPRQRRFRLNGEDIQKSAELARILPIQFLNQQSFSIVDQGPSVRRKFLDWGVFHVEPAFFPAWQQYQRALQQRNAALRNKTPDITAWTEECVRTAEPLHEMRRGYVARLQDAFADRQTTLLPDFVVSMDYFPGWEIEAGLEQVFKQDWSRDTHRGFTHSGPQRADLSFSTGNVPVVERLSRGQQKLLVSAMSLAQADVYADTCSQQCVILADDLSAELDQAHTSSLLAALVKTGAQVFLTVTHEKLLGDLLAIPHKLFHVKHGSLFEAEVV